MSTEDTVAPVPTGRRWERPPAAGVVALLVWAGFVYGCYLAGYLAQ